MSWFYEPPRIVTSERNGPIEVARSWGVWRISVAGCHQTSFYMTGLWEDACTHLPKDAGIKRILIIGLGAGGSLSFLRTRFPEAIITAIEWDPEMVRLMRELSIATPAQEPEILHIEDAQTLVPTLKETYDLIFMDGFTGPALSSGLATQGFFEAVAARLDPQGHAFLNVYSDRALLEKIGSAFALSSRWEYRLNTVALLRPKYKGTLGEALYPGYQPMRTNKAFLQREGSGKWGRTYVEVDGIPGLRWKSPLFFVDGFYGDVAPLNQELRPGRMSVWQPLTRTDTIIPGWRRPLVKLHQRLHGVAPLIQKEQYWKRWSSHAQRHRSHWLKQEGLIVQEIPLEAFLEAYLRTPTKFRQEIFLEMLRGRARCHGEFLRCWIVHEVATGKTLAGLVVLDVPEVKQSLHLAAFTHPDGMHRSAGLGLIDHWFQDGFRQGFEFLDFDLFWSAGDPVAWQGFSRFKGQFDIKYTLYPQPFTNIFFAGRRW
ncbi:hypothetical protein KBA73_01490 [Patescibacteria group bacterium]|nr:hypothetical protein [Patescibacteria group bacterium]